MLPIAALVTEVVSFTEADVTGAFSNLRNVLFSSSCFDGQCGIDGRDNKTVRPISVEVGMP